MKKLFVIVTCLIVSHVYAQHFTHQAEIKSVTSNTLYRITVDPTLRATMSSDFHDTRIMDSKGNEMPYIVMNEAPLKSTTDFVQYPIVSQKHTPLYSEVIVENPGKDKISNIAFNINNSDAYKYCAIEGSDDMKQWYTVSAKQALSLAYSHTYTNTYQCIYFPLNDYKYFRLLIDNVRAEAFKINSAGYFKNSVSPGKLVEVKVNTRIETNRKTRMTSVYVSMPSEQEISRLDFFITAPRLFKRNARIYVNEITRRKHHTEKTEKTLHYFELSSDSPRLFDLPLRAREFVIEIDNRDNPPLTIDSITFKQLAAYLVCDLAPNEKYTMKWGDKERPLPVYDLAGFVTSIPHLLPEVQIANAAAIVIPTTANSATEKSFVESRTFLWLCIIAGAIVVLFFTLSLVKEMRSRDAGN